jgi:hypothetical protein
MIRRGFPFAMAAMGIFLAVSMAWAGDGDNYFQFAYGQPAGDTLSNNLIRGAAAGSDLDDDGKYEIIVTDYDYGGMVHVYEVTGDNTLEWVWSSAATNALRCRQVETGDMDNDGIGEIICAITDGTWSDEYEGGIHIYEWDGTTDNGYGTEPVTIYHPSPEDSSYFRAEGFAIGDVDYDDQNELVLPYNTGPTAGDALYILSVSGTFESGFYVWNQEAVFKRQGTYPFGGSPTNAGIGDLDGDGHLEAIFGVWDYATLFIFEATGINTYEYQTDVTIDTVSGRDGASIDNFGVADLDEDGADEVYFNIYPGGEIAVITGGTDVSTITFDDNVFFIAATGEAGGYGMGIGDQDHGPGTDGVDIYTAAYTDGRVYDHEFTGTVPTDPASWTRYTLFEDTTGFSDGSFGISVPPGDLDGDGKLEIVATYQGADSAAGQWFRVFEWTGETGVEEYTIAVDVPREFQLAQNYPNPFNAQTTIEYTVSRPSHISLKIFNATGQLVKTLVNDYRPINRYVVTWDGTDEAGRPVASGVYFYQLVTGEYQQAKKMTLLK